MWMFLWLACTGADTGEPISIDPLSAAALTETVQRIVDVGPRLSGTPEEVEAAAVVEEMLIAAGPDRVERAPFVWDAWKPGAASVTIGDTVWPAEPLSPSPSTAGLRGVLLAADFSGEIALFSSATGSRADQYLQASIGGARAMIRISEETAQDGTPLIEVGHTFETSNLPALAVDARTGVALRAARGESVTIDIDAEVLPDHLSENLLGIVEGRSGRWIAVTAHYDSWHPSESAADNALGTAMLIQLAARLAQEPPPERGVLFLATAGEEQGLQGAFAWTEENPDWVDDVKQVINLDIPWADEGDHLCAASSEALAEGAADAMDAAGVSAIPLSSVSPSSDHFPFQVRGVEAALWCTRQPYRRYHTEQDTLDRIDLEQAALSLQGHWAILAEAAGVADP